MRDQGLKVNSVKFPTQPIMPALRKAFIEGVDTNSYSDGSPDTTTQKSEKKEGFRMERTNH